MTKRLMIGLTTLVIVLTACGSDPAVQTSADGSQSVKVRMKDIAFSPDAITVKAGQPIHFEFDNSGKLAHEAVIGDTTMQAAHEREMTSKSSSGMSGMGSGSAMDADGLTVAPGKTATLTHTFKISDSGIIIGCHEPGHYKAGMRITVTVVV